jgi:hypothetical protein
MMYEVLNSTPVLRLSKIRSVLPEFSELGVGHLMNATIMSTYVE